MSKQRICGIILAAGMGRRAGLSKLSRHIGNKTMLEHVAQKALNQSLAEVILVTGYEQHFAKEIAKSYGFKVCHNENYADGMSTSIIKGVEALPKACTAFAILLGDLPYLKSVTINTLLSAYQNSKKSIIVPVHKNQKGHPVIMSIAYKEQIFQITGDKGARDLIKENYEKVQPVEVDDPGVILDIDKFNDTTNN